MSAVEGLERAEYQKLLSDPRIFARNYLRHPGNPQRKYDFRTTDGETKINFLLNDDGPLNPENWGNINVLKFARGCLKTTCVRMIATWAHHMYLQYGIRGYMTAPREKPPITGFMDQFDESVRQAGLDVYREKDNLKYQKFEVIQEDNETGETYPVTSVLEADSGYDPDSLRGPHSHYGVIDEFQDIGKEAFDTYSHCIDREVPGVSYFPAIFIIGTPKNESSFYHDLWQQTDQNTWDSERRSWVQKSDPGVYKPSEDLLDELNIDPDEEEVPEHEVRGWHVDHYNSPLHSAADIARAQRNLSTQQFHNEVKAEFYSPEDNLLSIDHVTEIIFDDDIGFCDRPRADGAFVTLATDWGGGVDKNAADTVIAVAEHTTDDVGRVDTEFLHINFLDDELSKEDEVKRVEERLIQYNVDKAVVDYGHGYHAMENLQDGENTLDPEGYLDTVVGAKFGNIKHKSDVKWEQDSGKRRFFTCDKTNTIDSAVEAAKQGRITIPAANISIAGHGNKGRKIVNQLTAPYKDYVETPSGSKKVRIEKDDNAKDDMLDVLAYTWLARHQVGPRNMPSAVAMTARPGH